MREALYDNYHMRKWKCASCCAKDKTFDRKLFKSESSFQSQLPHHCHDHNQHWVMNHSQSDWSWKVCKSSQGGGFCTISDANQHRNPASSSWSWWSWIRIIITIIITRRREVVHNQLCKSAASRGRWECNTLDMLVTRVQPQHSGRIFKEK